MATRDCDEAISVTAPFGLDEIELDELYRFQMPTTISDSYWLDTLLPIIRKHHPEIKDKLPNFTLRTYRDEKGVKFTTALKKHLYDEYGISAKARLAEEIGDKLSALTVWGSDIIFFSIVDSFDWNAGEFGDSGSCFWGSRNFSRQTIKDNGGRALLVYNQFGRGMARAWIKPEETGIALFNAYGINIEYVAKLLSAITGKPHIFVDVAEGTDVYINNGSAAYIGEAKLKSRVLKIDWYTFCKCKVCGKLWRGKYGDEGKYQRDKEGRFLRVCRECKKGRIECYNCSTVLTSTDLKEFNPEEKILKTALFYCPSCLEIIVARCPVCGELDDISELDERAGEYRKHSQCQIQKG